MGLALLKGKYVNNEERNPTNKDVVVMLQAARWSGLDVRDPQEVIENHIFCRWLALVGYDRIARFLDFIGG